MSHAWAGLDRVLAGAFAQRVFGVTIGTAAPGKAGAFAVERGYLAV